MGAPAPEPSVLVDAADVAAWLDRQPTTLWTVDGEDSIAASMSLPASAEEVAYLLRSRGGKLRIFAADAAALARWDERRDVDALARRLIRGEEALFLAWDVEGQRDRASWALLHDHVAEEALASLV